MTPEQREAAIAVEDQLHAIQNDPARDVFARHTAAEYFSQVESLRHYLEAPDHKVVLIGGKGSGKSGWLAMVTGLHIGDQPRSNDELRKRSVLPLGSGGTSVCELRIRRASDALCPNRNGADYGLTIEPKSDEDLLSEIDLFAERMWKAVRNPPPPGVAGDDGGNASAPIEVEIDRLIRGMTGCPKQRAVQPTAAGLQPMVTDPLRQLIDSSSSLDALTSALKERAHLHARKKTEWWEHGDRDESLTKLKALLKAINSGLEPSSPFPAAITLWIPLSDDLDDIQQHLTFTDSRGFDQPLEGRADLQAFLRDERAVCILCVPFQAPPGNEFRNLLKTVLRTPALSTAIDRIRILIMDLGLASQVADVEDDDRIHGQGLKRDSCIESLRQEGLEVFSVDGQRVYVFDALQDDLNAARTMVSDSVDQLRRSKAQSLEDAIARANEFVENVTIDHARALMQEVDNQLLQTFANNKPSLNQLDDAVEGVISLVKDEHAARVNAMCRRRGEYEDLDAYEAIRAAVESWFHEQHFRSLYVAMAAMFQNLATGPRYATVRSHVQTRKTAFDDGRLALGLRVSKVVQSELRAAMRSHAVWTECVNEFGRGLNKPPYRERVGGHIQSFGDQHTHHRPIRWDFTAQDFGLPPVPQQA